MQYMFLADSPSYIRLTNQKWLADLKINLNTGYDIAKNCAQQQNLDLPMLNKDKS